MRYLFFLISFFFFPSLSFAEDITNTTLSSPFSLTQSFSEYTENTGFFSALQGLEKKKSLVQEKKNILKIKENKNFVEVDELLILEEEYQKVQALYAREELSDTEKQGILDFLDEYGFLEGVTLENVMTTQKALENEYNEKVLALETILSEKKTQQETEILQIKQEIQDLEEEILIGQEQYTQEIKDGGVRIGVFIMAFLFLILIQSVVSRAIDHLGEKHSLPENKIAVLKVIKKWLFNIIYFSLFLLFFSVQILNILPFLAILGTALGFALRDVISSFIAWFIIGMNEGYKEGDIVKVDESIFGRVISITTLLTELQELGMSGPTGKYLTFPNKKIFEGKIQNWSKLKGYIYISIEFYLTQESNLQKAKEILENVMQEKIKQEDEISSRNRSFFKKMNIKEEKLIPFVHYDIKPQGIFMRGKVFVYFNRHNDLRTRIVEGFIDAIRGENDITIRFLNMA